MSSSKQDAAAAAARRHGEEFKRDAPWSFDAGSRTKMATAILLWPFRVVRRRLCGPVRQRRMPLKPVLRASD